MRGKEEDKVGRCLIGFSKKQSENVQNLKLKKVLTWKKQVHLQG
jgi:hypothetical protein